MFASTKHEIKTLNVILFQAEGSWFAQALQRDVQSCGDDVKDAVANFNLTLIYEAKQKGGLDRINAAPKRYQQMWEGSKLYAKRQPERLSGETFQLIEYRITDDTTDGEPRKVGSRK